MFASSSQSSPSNGTFKSCSPLFTQVYTINVIKHNLVIPVVFALKPDKTQSSTNNYVKRWHKGFNNLLSSCHPTIWKFIEAIQKEQSLNDMKINQSIAGTIEPSRKQKRDILKELVNDYENRDRLEYLRGVAYNLSYQI
ncbi:hypothetical protein QTP88_008546 [Uroleucon formosanum]